MDRETPNGEGARPDAQRRGEPEVSPMKRLNLGCGSRFHPAYLHVSDLAAAIMKLLTYRGSEKISNVSSGVGHSVLDIMSILQNLRGSLPEVIQKPERPYDVPVNVFDHSRLHKETGSLPVVSLEEGIAQTVAALKASRNS